MLEITFSSSFKTSYKKYKKNKGIVKEVEILLDKLANNEILEQKYCDHQLQGKYKDFRECHIRPNLLLIYQKQQEKLVLYCLNIGSHSDLF